MFSNAILNMSEQQVIAQKKEKWWKEENMPGAPCSVKKKSSATQSLSIKNVGGVFVVLAGGAFGGFLIAICEFVYKARKNAREDEVCNNVY